MAKKLGIPVGLIGSGLTLQQAYIHGVFIDAFLAGKDESINVNDLASDTGLSEELIERAIQDLSFDRYVDYNETPHNVSSYKIDKVVVHLKADQLKMACDTTPQPSPKITASKLTDEVTIDGKRYEASVEDDEDEGVVLFIDRLPEGEIEEKTIVDGMHFVTREEAWTWFDDWSKDYSDLPCPFEWLKSFKENGHLEGEKVVELAPRSFWALVKQQSIERAFVEQEDTPEIVIADLDLTVRLGTQESLQIEGYEEPEQGAFDLEEEPDEDDPVQITDAEFTVLVSVEGEDTEVRVAYTKSTGSDDDGSEDDFIFIYPDGTQLGHRVPTKHVPSGLEAIEQFARKLAQDNADGIEQNKAHA